MYDKMPCFAISSEMLKKVRKNGDFHSYGAVQCIRFFVKPNSLATSLNLLIRLTFLLVIRLNSCYQR